MRTPSQDVVKLHKAVTQAQTTAIRCEDITRNLICALAIAVACWMVLSGFTHVDEYGMTYLAAGMAVAVAFIAGVSYTEVQRQAEATRLMSWPSNRSPIQLSEMPWLMRIKYISPVIATGIGVGSIAGLIGLIVEAGNWMSRLSGFSELAVLLLVTAASFLLAVISWKFQRRPAYGRTEFPM